MIGWLCSDCGKFQPHASPRVCMWCHWDIDRGEYPDYWDCKKCGNHFKIGGCRLCFVCGWCEDCQIIDEEYIGYEPKRVL